MILEKPKEKRHIIMSRFLNAKMENKGLERNYFHEF